MKIALKGSYTVEVQPDPFSFAILRGRDTILRCVSYEGNVVSSDASGAGISITFENASVTLKAGDGGLSVRWQSANPVLNSFPLDGRWYGQGELIHQLWPLNRAMIAQSNFTTIDNGPSGLSCILSPVWLSEHGVALAAHSPISLSLNNPPDHLRRHQWDFGPAQGPFRERPYPDTDHEGDGCLTISGENLEYEILLGQDIVEAHHRLTARMGHCTEIPPTQLIEQPIWNTWARYHAEIDQERVLTYAREIIDHGYPAGRFVIDDRWQVKYGDLSFDTGRFPDAHGMIDTLHEMGFSAHTWVVPFFDPASQAFQEGAERGYLVRSQEGAPRLTVWWQGIGGLLDVTNPDALAWFLGRLRHLQAESGLDGFKFDAGEACFLPADSVTFEQIDSNGFTHRYIEFVGRHFAWSDVRAGWANQRSPVLFRQWDKASTWGLDNGLHSVISGALSLSLSGYPLFLPDMIGGNAYVEQPDAELMIRWAQVNALMPGMQFSLAPWDFGEECSRLCLKAVELHKELSPTIMRAIQRSATSGEPIIRPLFWIAPHDATSLDCDDEFLLGDDLLAAPVIEPGQRQRDIYLPVGQWEDHWTGQQYSGAEWIRGYAAPLEVIPLFKRRPV